MVPPSPWTLPLFAALGIGAGILGVIFNRGLLGALAVFESMRRVPQPLRAAAVGVLAALVACWLPAAIGSGEPVARVLIQGPPSPLATLVVLLAVKLVLTLASYGCGVPGGIFAPQLVLGATLGAIVHALAPSLGGGALGPALATAGMVGVFSASVRAPLTGLVLVVELTHRRRAAAAAGHHRARRAISSRPAARPSHLRGAAREGRSPRRRATI